MIIFFKHLAFSEKLNICTQNLERYSASYRTSKRTPILLAKKEAALLYNIKRVNCDIVACQELYGSNKKEREQSAIRFSELLSVKFGEKYNYVIGEGTDPFIRNVLFYKRNIGILTSVKTDSAKYLPTLNLDQKPIKELRAPLEVHFKLNQSDASNRSIKRLILFVVHFKSKNRGYKDPLKLDWEAIRVLEAVSLHQKIKKFTKQRKSLIVVLGDFNAESPSASRRILSGERSLEDLQNPLGCKINKNQELNCKSRSKNQKVLFSALEKIKKNSPTLGTHAYKSKSQWIDDIMILVNSRISKRFLKKGVAGVLKINNIASDHALVGIRLAR